MEDTVHVSENPFHILLLSYIPLEEADAGVEELLGPGGGGAKVEEPDLLGAAAEHLQAEGGADEAFTRVWSRAWDWGAEKTRWSRSRCRRLRPRFNSPGAHHHRGSIACGRRRHHHARRVGTGAIQQRISAGALAAMSGEGAAAAGWSRLGCREGDRAGWDLGCRGEAGGITD